jgi:hypothetical protein
LSDNQAISVGSRASVLPDGHNIRSGKDLLRGTARDDPAEFGGGDDEVLFGSGRRAVNALTTSQRMLVMLGTPAFGEQAARLAAAIRRSNL